MYLPGQSERAADHGSAASRTTGNVNGSRSSGTNSGGSEVKTSWRSSLIAIGYHTAASPSQRT